MSMKGIWAHDIEHFLEVWTGDTLLEDIATSLSCTEADAMAGLLRFFDQADAADSLIAAHAEGDDEGDEHWTGA